MANRFNVTMQLQVAGPNNIRPIINSLQSQLNNARININPQISPQAARTASSLAAGLGNVQTNARGAAVAMRGLGVPANAAASMTNFARQTATATRSVRDLETGLGRAVGQAEKLGQTTGRAVRYYSGFILIIRALSGVQRAFSDSIREALDFEREMVKIAQVGGDTRQQVGTIAKEISTLSKTFGASSAELAKVSVTLRQAGLSANDTRIALSALAKTTLAPTFDNLNNTVEGSIALMQQFKIQAKDLERVLGGVNTVAGAFAVESSDLVAAIRKAGGAFRAASGDFTSAEDSLNQLIALFTSVRQTTRESADEISTGLRTVFSRLQNNNVASSLKQMGIDLRFTREEAKLFGKDVEGQFVTAFEAIRRLSLATRNLPTTDPRFAAIAEQIGGYRQISRVIPLLQQFNVAQRAYAVAQSGSNSLTRDAEKAQGALLVKFTKVKEELLDFTRAIGNNRGLQTFLDLSLKLASTFIKIAHALEPLAPALAIFATGKLVSGVTSFGKGFINAFSGQAPLERLKPVRKQSGGIVPGIGSGDKVPATLQVGDYVLRKRAVPKYQRGGTVPALLEPGELVIPAAKAEQIGYANLDRMNKHGSEHDDRLQKAYANLYAKRKLLKPEDWYPARHAYGGTVRKRRRYASGGKVPKEIVKRLESSGLGFLGEYGDRLHAEALLNKPFGRRKKMAGGGSVVPKDILQYFEAAGIGGIDFNKIVSSFEYVKDFSHPKFQNREGTKGLFDPNKRRIEVKGHLDTVGRARTGFHELTHAIDFAEGQRLGVPEGYATRSREHRLFRDVSKLASRYLPQNLWRPYLARKPDIDLHPEYLAFGATDYLIDRVNASKLPVDTDMDDPQRSHFGAQFEKHILGTARQRYGFASGGKVKNIGHKVLNDFTNSAAGQIYMSQDYSGPLELKNALMMYGGEKAMGFAHKLGKKALKRFGMATGGEARKRTSTGRLNIGAGDRELQRFLRDIRNAPDATVAEDIYKEMVRFYQDIAPGVNVTKLGIEAGIAGAKRRHKAALLESGKRTGQTGTRAERVRKLEAFYATPEQQALLNKNLGANEDKPDYTSTTVGTLQSGGANIGNIYPRPTRTPPPEVVGSPLRSRVRRNVAVPAPVSGEPPQFVVPTPPANIVDPEEIRRWNNTTPENITRAVRGEIPSTDIHVGAVKVVRRKQAADALRKSRAAIESKTPTFDPLSLATTELKSDVGRSSIDPRSITIDELKSEGVSKARAFNPLSLTTSELKADKPRQRDARGRFVKEAASPPAFNPLSLATTELKNDLIDPLSLAISELKGDQSNKLLKDIADSQQESVKVEKETVKQVKEAPYRDARGKFAVRPPYQPPGSFTDILPSRRLEDIGQLSDALPEIAKSGKETAKAVKSQEQIWKIRIPKGSPYGRKAGGPFQFTGPETAEGGDEPRRRVNKRQIGFSFAETELPTLTGELPRRGRRRYLPGKFRVKGDNNARLPDFLQVPQPTRVPTSPTTPVDLGAPIPLSEGFTRLGLGDAFENRYPWAYDLASGEARRGDPQFFQGIVAPPVGGAGYGLANRRVSSQVPAFGKTIPTGSGASFQVKQSLDEFLAEYFASPATPARVRRSTRGHAGLENLHEGFYSASFAPRSDIEQLVGAASTTRRREGLSQAELAYRRRRTEREAAEALNARLARPDFTGGALADLRFEDDLGLTEVPARDVNRLRRRSLARELPSNVRISKRANRTARGATDLDRRQTVIPDFVYDTDDYRHHQALTSYFTEQFSQREHAQLFKNVNKRYRSQQVLPDDVKYAVQQQAAERALEAIQNREQVTFGAYGRVSSVGSPLFQPGAFASGLYNRVRGRTTPPPAPVDPYSAFRGVTGPNPNTPTQSRFSRYAQRFGGFATGTGFVAAAFAPQILEHQFGSVSNPRGSQGAAKYAAATGGAIQFGAVGAQVGLSAGPYGAAAGAVAGVIYGFVSTLTEANNQLKEIEFDKEFRKFSLALNDVVSGAVDVSHSLGIVNSGIDRASTEAARRTEAAGFGSSFLSRNLGAYGRASEKAINFIPSALGFNNIFSGQEELQKQAAIERRKQRGDILAAQLPGIQQLGNRIAETVKLKPEDLEVTGQTSAAELERRRSARLQAFSDAGGKKIIETLADLQDIPVQQIADNFDRLVVSSNKARLQQESHNKVVAAATLQLQQFTQLGQAVEAASTSVLGLKANAEVISGLFEGTIVAPRTTGFAEAAGQIGGADRGAFERAVKFTTTNLGTSGGNIGGELGNAVLSIDQVMRDLPTKLADATARSSEEQISGDIHGAFRGLLPDEGVAKEFERRLSLAADSIDPKELQKRVGENPQKLADDLIREAFGELPDVMADITKQIQDRGNELANELVKAQNARNQIAEIRGQVPGALLNVARTNAAIQSNRTGRPTGDFLTLDDLRRPFAARQQVLAGANAFNPTGISQQYGGVANEIQRRQRELDNPGLSQEQRNQTVQDLVKLQSEAGNLQKALQNLANTSEETAAIQEKLNEVERQRAGQLNFTERVLTADPEQRRNIRRGAFYSDVANQQGSFAGFNAQQINSALEHLRSLGEVALPGYGGRTGNAQADRLLENSQRQLGLFGNRPDQLKTQRDQLLGEQKTVEQRGADALTALANVQENANNKFIANLKEQNTQFLSKMDELIKASAITNAQNQVNRANIAKGQAAQRLDRATEIGKEFSLRPGDPGIDHFRGLLSSPELGNLRTTSAELKSIRLPGAVAAISRGEGAFKNPGNNIDNLIGPLAGISGLSPKAIREQVIPKYQASLITDPQANRTTALATAVQAGGTAEIKDLTKRRNEAEGAVVASGFGATGPRTEVERARAAELANRVANAPELYSAQEEEIKGIADTTQAMKALAIATQTAAEAAEKLGKLTTAPGKADGGVIFSPRGTDTVPAMLTPGEFVVNRKAAAKHRSLLENINYLASGGPARYKYSRDVLPDDIRKKIEEQEARDRARHQDFYANKFIPGITKQTEVDRIRRTAGQSALESGVAAYDERYKKRQDDAATLMAKSPSQIVVPKFGEDVMKKELARRQRRRTQLNNFYAQQDPNMVMAEQNVPRAQPFVGPIKPRSPELERRLRRRRQRRNFYAIQNQQSQFGFGGGFGNDAFQLAAGRVFGFAHGGAVGTDTVPAMLTPGEFIVSRSAAQANMPALQRMNKTAYRANGGPITAGAGGTIVLAPDSISALTQFNKSFGDAVNGFATPIQQLNTAVEGLSNFGRSIGDLTTSLGGFNTAASGLAERIQPFSDAAAKLAETLSNVNIPSTIQIQTQARVELLINGAQTIAAIKGDTANEVAKQVMAQLEPKIREVIGQMPAR